MTNEEKIAQGLCTAQTDSITGEITIIPYTDGEIDNTKHIVETVISPTLDELKAQLVSIQDQILSLKE